jgi:hypothetical protein
MEMPRTDGGVRAPVARPAGATQKITISGTSAKTTEFTNDYTIVRVAVNTDCYLRIGATGDNATTSYAFLPSGIVEYFYAMNGDFFHFIRDSADGFATVTVCS